jgi:SAM-dependent methyltransferase
LNFETIEMCDADWARLADMRAAFLAQGGESGPTPDYWTSTRDLEIYDVTFGARISWKWNAVLDEIARRGIAVPAGSVLDWGAGTGVAARAFLAKFGAADRRVSFHDRSRAAVAFANEKTRAEHPLAALAEEAPDAPDVMLASHVLEELDDAGRAQFVALARRARLLIWVESGAKSNARALSGVREALLEELDPLLPCTHRSACGVLAAGREGDWCHHFAAPAPEAFTTNHWRTFSRTLSIDMRALPYSYLVMSRRSASTRYEDDAVRVLGTPRIEKGRATLTVCAASGLREAVLLERVDRPWFKALEKGKAERRIAIREAEGRIARIEPR